MKQHDASVGSITALHAHMHIDDYTPFMACFYFYLLCYAAVLINFTYVLCSSYALVKDLNKILLPGIKVFAIN